MSQDNVDKTEAFIAAYNRRDFDAAIEFFDPEIERRQRAVALNRGFELQDHALSLYAVCTKANCEFRRKG